MGKQLIKLFFTLLLVSMLITSVSSQDEYYGDMTYRFSEHLKEGVELTWIFSQYSITAPDVTNSGPTTVTYYEESATTDEFGNEVTFTTQYVYDESNDDFDFPDFPENTLYTVKIVKDLINMTENEYYDLYEEYDEYFEQSFSYSNGTEMMNFITPDAVIRPSIIEFDNGTQINAIEYQYKQQLEWEEESTENTDIIEGYPYEEYSSDYYIRDGVYTEKSHFAYDNETYSTEIRTDVDTGVVVYIYSFYEGLDFRFEIELKLYETVGIDISNPGPNEELNLPLSPFFAYALLATPIFISKYRKR